MLSVPNAHWSNRGEGQAPPEGLVDEAPGEGTVGEKAMTLPDFTERFVSFVWVFANLVVCGLASQLYQTTRRRGVLLLGVAAGLGAISTLLPWIRPASASWGYWYLINLMDIAEAGLWLVGTSLLLREFGDLYRKFAKGAAGTAGPAAEVGHSGVTGGPPAVSGSLG